MDFSQKKLQRGDEGVLKLQVGERGELKLCQSINECKFQLWDIMGQEEARTMTRVYYRGAAGCLVMFDLTQRQSFVSVKKWKEDLDSKVRWKDKKLPTLLVGNKVIWEEMGIKEFDRRIFFSLMLCIVVSLRLNWRNAVRSWILLGGLVRL